MIKTKVNIQNAQTVPISSRMLTQIRKTVFLTLEYMKITLPFEINIKLVSDVEIKDLNRDFRGIDEKTDVLSFPSGEYHDDVLLKKNERLFLGDIAICVETAYKQRQTTKKDELMLLTAHSVLHLLGFDHATKKDEKIMFKYQEEIVRTAKESP